MGSQGLMTKGVPFEESEGVPMLFAWKNHVVPARYGCVFSSIDIMPTLASLAGLDAPGADGTDYSPLLAGKDFRTTEYAFTEFNYGGIGEKSRPWRAVFSEDYVYILAGPCRMRTEYFTEGYVLFDRKKDPYQMNPIVRGMGYDSIIDEYHRVLVSHLESTGDRFMEQMWNVSEEELPDMPYLNKYNPDPNLESGKSGQQVKGKIRRKG